MTRTFLFAYVTQGSDLQYSIRPLVPDMTKMDFASNVKFANAMKLVRHMESKNILGPKVSASLSHVVMEVAKAIGIILEAEFPLDDIEIIDEATAQKRVDSGEYTSHAREVMSHAN